MCFYKDPNFRSSYGYKDKVFFFFSELDTSENSDVLFKTPASFVGEICADDDGRKSYNYGIARFLTFKKAVINCYLPDFTEKIHIKYNEIRKNISTRIVIKIEFDSIPLRFEQNKALKLTKYDHLYY